MRRIFRYLLSGFLLMLLLLENPIVLQASEHIHCITDSFKSVNCLVDYASVSMFLYQNGTERHPNMPFVNLAYTRSPDSYQPGTDGITLMNPINDLYFMCNKFGYLSEPTGISLYENKFHQHFLPINI